MSCSRGRGGGRKGRDLLELCIYDHWTIGVTISRILERLLFPITKPISLADLGHKINSTSLYKYSWHCFNKLLKTMVKLLSKPCIHIPRDTRWSGVYKGPLVSDKTTIESGRIINIL